MRPARIWTISCAAFLLACGMAFPVASTTAAAQTAPPPNHPEHGLPEYGFKDTPMLPGLPWHVHDPDRPHPPVVVPSAVPEGAPSDAIVLFDGKNLSHWQSLDNAPGDTAPRWKLAGGYLEVVPHSGNLASKEKFGDIQLHIEWSSPDPPTGESQGRGNSGIFLMGRYEIQVLDAWNNPTYADGQAGALYGQWPPLANPARRPGEWNVYDIVFEAPKFRGGKLLKPATVTVLFNGVLVQNHKELMGPTVHREVAHYVTQPDEDSIVLQDHNSPVRFRNIWVRRLTLDGQP